MINKAFYTEEDVAGHSSNANKNLIDRSGQEANGILLMKHQSNSKWFCKCHCGNIFVAVCHNVLKGKTKSCGCTKGVNITNKLCKNVSYIRDKLREVKPEYEVVTEGHGATSMWGFKCTTCLHKFTSVPAQMYGSRGRTPCKCSPSYRRTEEEWHTDLQDMCNKSNYIYLGKERRGYETYVNLHCTEHNHSWVTKAKHFFNGSGCNKCGEDETARKNSIHTTESIISDFIMQHGDRYDYSKVAYTGWDDKLTITCPQHGTFLQRYKDHKKSSFGCPSCAKYGFKPKEPAYLYLLTSKDKCKIGITNNKVDKRVRQINTSGNKNYKTLKYILFSKGAIAKRHETFIMNSLGISFGDDGNYSGSTEVTDIRNLSKILEYMENIVNE